ncbi:MAG: PQQ-binding-like beta-propeller repeat protein, partial [Planctomycetota bacterium]
QVEIPQIEDEPAFAESRGEFASLLPRIARGLAEEADTLSAESGTNDRVSKLVASASEALTLVNNTKYVPKSLRDDADLAVIRELLERVDRRREAVADLEETLAKIDTALSGGDVSQAYAAQTALLRRRPELRDDPRLAEKLSAAVEAERQVVTFVADEAAAETDERPGPLALALANPRRTGTVEANGVFTTTFGGVLYAVKASDGTLLWRQPVGTRLADVPAVPIDGDLLVVDHRYGELRRVNSASGALVWRVPLDGTGNASKLLTPVVAGRTVLVASESGRLWSLDATSGKRRGYANFAQPLRSPPAVDESRGKVHVAGEQSSLYTLDSKTLDCVAVRFTGHAAGSVPVAPLAIGGRVITLENTGAETAQFRLYATDDDGLISNQLRDWRLEGIVSTPPTVSGRRVLVTTDSGAVYLFEVTATTDGQPLILIASRAPLSGSTRARRAVEARGDVWIAGEGLRRTAASLADSQLVSRDLPNPCDGDLFFGSFVTRGEAVLHTRRREGRPGATLAASNSRSGKLVWETDIAVPPLGPPAVSARPRGLVATNLVGQTHLLGGRAINARVSPKPATTPRREQQYDGVLRLDDGIAIASVTGRADWTVMRAGSEARTVSLPGELACLPERLGDAIVTPLRVGQVHLLEAAGSQSALPFQPSVAAGQSIDWTPPAAETVGGEPLIVLSDGLENVYCLSLKQGDSPALIQRGIHTLAGARPRSRAAIVGRSGAIGLEGGRLAVYDLPDMATPRFVKVGGDLVWGPYPAGDVLLTATVDRPVAIGPDNASIAWEADLANGLPVGAPLVEGGDLVIVTANGYLATRSLSDGSTGDAIDLGQRAASGATAYGSRLLVSAADGAVLVINKP